METFSPFLAMDEFHEDVLDVLADVARLRERGGVAGRERNVEDAGERAREQRLAAARGAEQKDVALFDLDVVLRLFARKLRIDALVVIIDGDGEHALRLVLPDDILIELLLDLGGLFEFDLFRRLVGGHLFEHIAAEFDAFVTDEHAVRSRDEFFYFGAFLPAEGTALFIFCHKNLPHGERRAQAERSE